MKQPETTVARVRSQHGGPLYKTNPDQCCFDRKVKVLQQAVVGMNAWMSGIRRDQSPDRAEAPIVGWDKKFGLVKISPLGQLDQEGRLEADHRRTTFPTTRCTTRATPASAAGPARGR